MNPQRFSSRFEAIAMGLTVVATAGCGVDTSEELGAGGKAERAIGNARDEEAQVKESTAPEKGGPSNATTCTSPFDCPNGNCVDGFCCNSSCVGTCIACSHAKTGGTDGLCLYIPVGTDPDNECPGACGWAGTCDKGKALLGIGSDCGSGLECATGICVDGVCCDVPCAGTCQSCLADVKGHGLDGQCGFISANTDPSNECPGTDCNGFGVCGPSPGMLTNGLACTSAMDCLSGFCVDGVCCDTACTSACQACTNTKKGAGATGACGPIAATTDPDNECPLGSCNGSGACGGLISQGNGTACSVGTDCASGFCVDGVCCNSACSGTCMACTGWKKGSGVNGTCGPIANATDPDNECAANDCNGSGACGNLSADGAPCSNSAQCGSNHCVDGVCCNTACGASCQACNFPGSVGTCTSMAAGQSDPNGSPACTGTCDGNGGCVKPAGSACTAGSECASHICNELVCESPKPTNGPLVWMTIRNGNGVADEDPMFHGGRKLDLSEISSQLGPGGEIHVNGIASAALSNYLDYEPLSGWFNAAGEPQLSRIDHYGTYNSRRRALYRGAIETYYEKAGICSCYNWWSGFPDDNWAMPFGASGRNDTGQYSVLVKLSGCGGDCLHYTFDVGDGEPMNHAVLLRYSGTGSIELKIPPPNLMTDPIVLGPGGEFHSMDPPKLNFMKFNLQGVQEWYLPIPSTLTSFEFDVDANGNILFGFSFSGTVNFGGGPMTATNKDLGLVKLTRDGTVIWQKHFAGDVEGVHLRRVGARDFAILARRATPMDVGTGPITGNTFLAKFDESGTALWHASFNNLGYLTLSGDNAGSIYVGTSSLTADFGWGTPMANMQVGIAMAKYGTCTGPGGCKARYAACSADTECGSGLCSSGACF